MRRLLAALLGMLLAALALVGALVWYIQPTEDLDLTYSRLSLSKHIGDMIKSRQFAVEISESELNDLLKERLSRDPQLADRLVVTGARFSLRSGELTANVNAMLDNKVRLAGKVSFALEWENPTIVAVPVRWQLKKIEIPPAFLGSHPIALDLSTYLPNIVRIKSLTFQERSIRVVLGLTIP